jgi:1,4-alpha-glucan branching enzyme
VIRCQPVKGSTDVKVTFVLDPNDQSDPGPVSVVGNFNDWSPFAHVMKKRSNGTRSATVVVPAGSSVHFRYLGHDGHWFDDPDATVTDDQGGVLTV